MAHSPIVSGICTPSSRSCQASCSGVGRASVGFAWVEAARERVEALREGEMLDLEGGLLVGDSERRLSHS